MSAILATLPRRLLLCLLLAGTTACGEPAALAVGSIEFTESDLRGLSEVQVASLARIAAVAVSAGRDEVDELGEPLLERRVDETLVRRLREELALEWADVGEAALEAHYSTRPEWELEVRHLVVLSERWRNAAHREDARARALAAHERIAAGEPFVEVAGEVSEEPGADERGGLLEPGREGTWVEEFWDAASSLEVGETSAVVETPYGFHVMRLEDRRAVPFAEARDRAAAGMAGRVDDPQRWERWVQERMQEVSLEAELVTGRDVLHANGTDVVARWPGGEMTLGELGRRLSSLPADEVERFGGGGDDVRMEIARSLVRARMLAGEARERGLALPDEETERIAGEWRARVTRWVAVLELTAQARQAGAGGAAAARADDVDARERVLAGLTSSGQERRIVRGEIERRGPMIDRVMPGTRPGADVRSD